jgi:hypothetical protein
MNQADKAGADDPRSELLDSHIRKTFTGFARDLPSSIKPAEECEHNALHAQPGVDKTVQAYDPANL